MVQLDLRATKFKYQQYLAMVQYFQIDLLHSCLGPVFSSASKPSSGRVVRTCTYHSVVSLLRSKHTYSYKYILNPLLKNA